MKRNIFATILVTGSISVTAQAQSTLYFTSSPGSWVGEGQTMTFSTTNGHSVRVLSETGFANVLIDGGYWDLELGTPDGSPFAVGLYPNAGGWGQGTDIPLMEFSGGGRGDDVYTGWFNVLAVTQSGGVISSMAVDFMQYDEGISGEWERGSFRYNSDIPLHFQEMFALSAPMNLECMDGFATGTVNAVVQDPSGNAELVLWTLDGVPVQTNNIPAGGALMATNLTLTESFSSGQHIVSAYASNGQTPPATSSTTVTVQDTAPPQVLNITATPNVLWPPNHQMVSVNVTVNAVDNCDPSPTAQITQVTCNEPQGPSVTDWSITGPLSVDLRAERPGNSDQIYTIYVDVSDSSGNKTTVTTTVTVPHSQSTSP